MNRRPYLPLHRKTSFEAQLRTPTTLPLLMETLARWAVQAALEQATDRRLLKATPVVPAADLKTPQFVGPTPPIVLAAVLVILAIAQTKFLLLMLKPVHLIGATPAKDVSRLLEVTPS